MSGIFRFTRDDAAARGVHAGAPWSIPVRGWMDILKRVFVQTGRNRIGFTAAGVAFYSLLALFPAIVAAITLWGIFADPTTILNQIEAARTFLPPDAADLIQGQAAEVATSDAGAMSITLLLSLGFVLFGASRGAKALMHALNIVYGETERRNILNFNLSATAITLGIVLWLLTTFGVIVLMPALFAMIGYEAAADSVAGWLRWPILFAAAWAGIAVVFRYAPSRRAAKWLWVTPGAGVAVALWLAASAGFSVYVQNFANYNEIYGALGAVVILLMWFWVSAFVILLGATFDSELERQTEVDTTVGPERPLGKRGALVADYPSPARSAADITDGPPPDPRT